MASHLDEYKTSIHPWRFKWQCINVLMLIGAVLASLIYGNAEIRSDTELHLTWLIIACTYFLGRLLTAGIVSILEEVHKLKNELSDAQRPQVTAGIPSDSRPA